MSEGQYASRKIKSALQTSVYFKLGNLTLAFIFQIVVVKVLVPVDYATYAVLLAILMTGERALSFGIDRTVMRFVPGLTLGADGWRLRRLILQIAVIRLCALTIFFGVLLTWIVMRPTSLDFTTYVAFAIWFLSYTLFNDADAFAQSWLAHFDSAVAGFFEVTLRLGATLIIGIYFKELHVESTIAICAGTSTISLAILCWRLRRFAKLYEGSGSGSTGEPSDHFLDSTGAPMFALANYASTAVYLISSPAMVRIIATGGLDVITLAAFSFAQGLYISLQRIFPGLLVLPSLEPIMMSRLFRETHDDRVFAGLSLVYKLELICIFVALIATTVAGSEIVTILSRKEYSQFFVILPILIGSLVFITSYRIFEIIANMNFKQNVFFLFWPLSCFWMSMLYLTVGKWGLTAILLWPIVDITSRIALLSFVFRKYNIARAFDLNNSICIGLSAGIIILITLVLFPHSNAPDLPYWILARALIGIMVFLASLFVIKPFHQLEFEALAIALPSKWNSIGALARAATRL